RDVRVAHEVQQRKRNDRDRDGDTRGNPPSQFADEDVAEDVLFDERADQTEDQDLDQQRRFTGGLLNDLFVRRILSLFTSAHQHSRREHQGRLPYASTPTRLTHY